MLEMSHREHQSIGRCVEWVIEIMLPPVMSTDIKDQNGKCSRHLGMERVMNIKQWIYMQVCVIFVLKTKEQNITL